MSKQSLLAAATGAPSDAFAAHHHHDAPHPSPGGHTDPSPPHPHAHHLQPLSTLGSHQVSPGSASPSLRLLARMREGNASRVERFEELDRDVLSKLFVRKLQSAVAERAGAGGVEEGGEAPPSPSAAASTAAGSPSGGATPLHPPHPHPHPHPPPHHSP